MIPFHPLADMFPMLNEAELSDLAADIKVNGLRESIWLYEGKILDGRNRYCACATAGVTPTFRSYNGDEPTSFVISLNLHRRHLTYDQRVGLALKIRPALAEEAKRRAGARTDLRPHVDTGYGRSDEQAAKAVGVGKSRVNEMARISEEQPTLVDDLLSGKTTVREVRAEANRKKRVERMRPVNAETPAIETLQQRYAILYADPPWRYEHVISDSRAIENHYPTMEVDEICALPIADIATEHAVLFLWATSPKLKSAIQVIDAWGFEYKTCAVWCKDKIGNGYYFRQQHELLLVAVKGEPATPRTGDRLSSLIHAPRLEHSAKPPEVYDIIERMYPELPKVELFSRTARANWHSWGNQA